MNLIFIILVSCSLTALLMPLLIRLGHAWSLVDVPDARKVHQGLIPRVGGLGIIIGAFLPGLLWMASTGCPLTREFAAYLAGVGILLVTGVLDDVRGLSYRAKFCGQGLAALVTMVTSGALVCRLGFWAHGGEVILPLVLTAPLTFIFIVGITNALNLTDGLDGLAGGLSLTIFLTLALIAFLDGRTDLLVACCCICGALLGFLRYNTHPASVFMGDTGSLFLGYSAAIICIYLTQSPQTATARTLPLILLGLPILDTLSVMTARILDGHNPFKPDRRHLHHRLLDIGFSHKYAVTILYLIQTIIFGLAIRLRYATEAQVLLSAVSGGSLVLLLILFAPRCLRGRGLGERFAGRLARLAVPPRQLLQRSALTFIRLTLSLGLVALSIMVPLHFGPEVAVIPLLFLLALVLLPWNRRAAWSCFRLSAYILAAVLLISQRGAGAHLLWGSLGAASLAFLLAARTPSISPSPLDFAVLLLVLLLPFIPAGLAISPGTLAGGMLVFLWSSEICLRQQRAAPGLFPLSCALASLILLSRALLHAPLA